MKFGYIRTLNEGQKNPSRMRWSPPERPDYHSMRLRLVALRPTLSDGLPKLCILEVSHYCKTACIRFQEHKLLISNYFVEIVLHT